MTRRDPIEALLQATGKRPAIPAGRTERVRAAVEAGWRSEVAARGRRSLLMRRIAWAAAAVVVVAVVLGTFVLQSTMSPEPSGVLVERASGTAWAKRDSLLRAKTELAVGSNVPRGAAVTTAEDVRLALRAPTGHSMRLDTGTTLRVRSDREFELAAGAIYVDAPLDGAAGRSSIRIDTPFGVIEDQGTQFVARLGGGSLSLRVREGAVTLQTVDERLVAHAGEAIRLDASGGVDRSEEASEGGDWAWEWAETIAPMMEIEGRSLRDFLDWVVRERGVRLRFAGVGLAEKAPSIVLKGSVAGMTLEEATTSVLATSGLSGRWEKGTLVVSDASEAPQVP